MRPKWSHGQWPAQSFFIVHLLGNHSHQAGNAYAVGAHGGYGPLAGFIQNLQVESLGVLASQLEDVADLNAAGQGQGAFTVRRWIALEHLGSLDVAVWGEIATGNQAHHVAVLRIRAGDPGGTLHHAWVSQDAHAVGCETAGSHVTLDQEWVVLKVLFRGQFHRRGFQGSFQTLHVYLAVAGNQHAGELGSVSHAVLIHARLGHLHHDALESVRGFHCAAVNLHTLGVCPIHQSRDGFGIRGFVLFRLGLAIDGLLLGNNRDHGFHVGRVIGRGGAHEGIFTVLRDCQELFGGRSTHGTRGGITNGVLDAQGVEDLLVRPAVSLVALLQAGIIHVEGVRILHHELATAKDAGAWALLIAVLGLDLIEGNREVLVGAELGLHDGCEHFLVGRAQEVIAILAVLQAEQRIAVLGPAARGLVWLARKQGGEHQFLSTNGVHFLAHHVLHAAQYLQAQREPRIHTGCHSSNVACADQKLVARDLRIGGIIAQCAQK